MVPLVLNCDVSSRSYFFEATTGDQCQNVANNILSVIYFPYLVRCKNMKSGNILIGRWAQFTHYAEHRATGICKQWNTSWSMGVFTQLASNIKGFAGKCADASCVNGA